MTCNRSAMVRLKNEGEEGGAVQPVKILREEFFFFQREDGIRDYKVTGVQTCALPISRAKHRRVKSQFEGAAVFGTSVALMGERSEERRVGKECRSRWSPYH